MKTRTLSVTALCLLLLLTLILPSAALNGLTKEEEKTLMREHHQTCTDKESCLHIALYAKSFAPTVNGPVYGPYQHLTPEEIDALKETVKAMRAERGIAPKILSPCTHTTAYAFKDTDSGILSLYCPDCKLLSANWQGVSPVPVRETSAALRSICNHDFYGWDWLNDSEHIRLCTKCNFAQTGTHDPLPADCTTNSYCADCGGRGSDWEVAWGHAMEYIADEFAFGTTHSYRCGRRDNDAQLICSYVAYSESCSFQTYWDPEENGEHVLFEVCTACGNWGEYTSVPCDAIDGGSCFYCDNDGTWY